MFSFLFHIDADKNDHQVVDCSHRIMKEHCYWPLVSDLNNVLTHEAVAFEFLTDTELLRLWFKFLALFQGVLYFYKVLRL